MNDRTWMWTVCHCAVMLAVVGCGAESVTEQDAGAHAADPVPAKQEHTPPSEAESAAAPEAGRAPVLPSAGTLGREAKPMAMPMQAARVTESDAGAVLPPTAAGRVAPCVGDRLQGAFIGDSYITGFQSPALQPEVDTLLGAAGLVTGYPNYALAGAGMASGGISEPDLVPKQFDKARAASADIRLVVMNGGGNDWLLPAAGKPDCKNLADPRADMGCHTLVAEVIDTFEQLTQRMAQSGVRDIIFFGLPHFQPGGFAGLVGDNPNAMIDWMHAEEDVACAGALEHTGTLACHYIDLREFEDLTNFTHVVDGSHPSLSAQKTLAREIVAIMQAQCLGHDVASGCCTP